MTAHLEQTLQRDIDRLRRHLADMSELVERAVENSVQALVERNRQLAYMVVLRDRRIDEMEKQVDRLCLEFLVRQQPVASHLRLAYSTIKLTTEIERIGDYAEGIARQSLKLAAGVDLPCKEHFSRMGELVVPMLHKAIQAFLAGDIELARTTVKLDKEVDRLRTEINTALFSALQNGELTVGVLDPLLNVTRRLERVADQAKNICEEAHYVATGEFSKHKAGELVRILFLDGQNRCLSQMAEALGTSLGESRLIFASAGIAPAEVDPGTLDFLAKKGISVGRVYAKKMDQVPNLEDYQVVIGFGQESLRGFPFMRNKTVLLDWNVSDPTLVQGSPAEVQAAYERAWRWIQDHLQDLTEAILGKQQNQ